MIFNMHRINLTLVYFLIFTIITSAISYHLVVKAYDTFDVADGLTYDASVK